MATATFIVRAVADGSKKSYTVQVADPVPSHHPAIPTSKVYGYSYGTKNPSDTGDGTPDPVIAETGLKPAAFRKYFENTTSPASITATAVSLRQKGILPVCSLKVPNNDWAAVASGAEDAWVTGRLAALSAANVPAVLVPHHEPENDASSTGPRTPKTFDGMLRTFRRLITAGGYNRIALGICLMGGHYNPNISGTKADPVAWTSSKDVLDLLLLDQYVQWSPSGGGKQLTPQQAHGDLYAVFKPLIGSLPWGIAEHGVRTDPSKPGWAAKWMATDADLLEALGAVYQLYFNSDRNSPDGSWAIHSPDERWPVFTQLIQASPRVIAAS